MKTIKYLVMFLLAALVAGACTKDNGLSQQNKGKEKPVVGIIKGSSNDGIIKFEIVASEDAAQYAYAVLAGSGNQAPEALSILTTEVPGAEAGESFNTKGNLGASASANVILDCSTFTTQATEYEIFTVAITETGLMGDITSALIVMNDTVAPEPAAAAADNNMLQIAFSEPVVRGEGKVTVQYYKYVASKLTESVTVPSADITVSDNILTIICPKPAEGSVYYFLSLEKGVVEDLSGNQQAAKKSGIDNQGQPYGINWMSSPSTFAIGDNCFSTAAADWSAEDAVITFKLPYKSYDSGLMDGVKVAYRDDWGTKELIASYTLASDQQTVTVSLPEKPLGAFDVVIDEGVFYDEWGNWNAPRVTDDSYLYENYWMTLKGGRYLIEFQESEDETDKFASIFELYSRDIVLWNANWFNIWEDRGDIWKYVGALPTNLIGIVDYKTKTITFDGSWIYEGEVLETIAYGQNTYWWDDAQTQLMVFWGSGKTGQEPIVMTFDDEGYITSTTGFEYWIYDAETLQVAGVVAKTVDGSAVEYVSEVDGKTRMAEHNTCSPVAPFKNVLTR